MSRTKYTVWPEGEPEKAVSTSNWFKMQWLLFWTGLKTWYPTPLHACRVCCLTERIEQ